jgi:trigger factor
MNVPAIQTTTERVEKDRVKLHVEVPEQALEPAIAAVYRRWAQDMKVPGFRKGKVPRQLIEARVGGPEVIREEAVRDALPDLYREAMRAEDLQPIAPPDIELLEVAAGSPLIFEAIVDVRPEITLPDLSSIEIESPPSEVDDDDLRAQMDRLRDRFAELETVSRDARRGDYALIDLKGSQNDVPVEALSVDDYLYEIGSRSGPDKLDDELEGNRAGAILKFTSQVPAAAIREDGAQDQLEDVSFTVLVKEIKAKKLPEADDEFAKTVGEFDTLAELEEDLRTRLKGVKQQLVEEELRGLALTALVDASDLEAPEKLVESEFDHRLHHLEDDLQKAGLTLDAYGAQIQMTELEIRSDMRGQAAKAVKAELLLEEIARTQEIDVTEEDIGQEIAIAAGRAQRDPKEVAQQLVDSGRLSAVAADILRRKALDYVVGAVNVRTTEVTGESDQPE